MGVGRGSGGGFPWRELETGLSNVSAGDVPQVRLAAVGDLLLVAEGEGPSRRDAESRLDGIRSLLDGADVLFGNLECALAAGTEMAPTEPRVVATADQVRGTLEAGFNVVTLANNHAFDYREAGFREVCGLLDRLGVARFGAGDNLAQAAAPARLEVKGIRLAFVGAVDRRSGPSQFATEGQAGVAPLDISRLLDQIRRLRREVDHVIVSLHWGEERLRIPSPVQVEQAHALVAAGASLILGHHAHVVQGLEVYRGVPIIYSLGNFIASEVLFSSGDRVTWNRTGRTGCLLTVELARDGVVAVTQTPTYDDGRRVEPDGTGFGDRRIALVNRALARGVTLRRYRWEFFRVKTLRPALEHLRWSNIKRLSPRKVWKFLAGLGHAHKAE